MLPEDIDFLARKERQKDLLREIEREHYLPLKERKPINYLRLFRRLAGWLGDQMVRWGLKLRSYNTAALSQKGT